MYLKHKIVGRTDFNFKKNIYTFYSCKICTSDQSKAGLQSVENALGLSKGPILDIFQANSFYLLHT